jgi:predicted nucleic acid-binding protein
LVALLEHRREQCSSQATPLLPRFDADVVQVTENLPGIAAMKSVSSLKAEHPIAPADCFAIALAAEEEAELLTGDPEIIDLADQLPCKVVDLRD